MPKFDPQHAVFLDDEERKEKFPLEEILSLLELEKDDIVLDLGAGTGFLTFSIAEELEDGKIYAVDVQEEMLKKLEEKCSEKNCGNIVVKLSEEGDIPLPDEEVTKVISLNVLHEIEDMGTLEELKRVMKKEAEMCIVDWDRDVITERGPPTHVRLSLSEAIECLEENQFEVLDNGKIQDHFWMICKL